MIELRRAVPDDAPTMATVHIAAWRTAYRGLVPNTFLDALDHKQRSEQFRRFIAGRKADTWIVECDGESIGHLTIGPARDDDLDARITGEIWGIYLLPASWRHGIGTHVCRKAEALLYQRGFESIVLWVFDGNRRARQFYETLQYAPDGATRSIDVGAELPTIRYRRERTSRRTARS